MKLLTRIFKVFILKISSNYLIRLKRKKKLKEKVQDLMIEAVLSEKQAISIKYEPENFPEFTQVIEIVYCIGIQLGLSVKPSLVSSETGFLKIFIEFN